MNNTISLLTKVPLAVNAIDAGTVSPIVDTSVGPIILLNTSNRELGNLMWTNFDRETFFPISSWTCRYGAAQTLQQVLFEPFPSRKELVKILDQYLPDQPWVDCLPMIVPGCSITYPTAVTQPEKKPRKKREVKK
jgi:hypothetical protein